MPNLCVGHIFCYLSVITANILKYCKSFKPYPIIIVILYSTINKLLWIEETFLQLQNQSLKKL